MVKYLITLLLLLTPSLSLFGAPAVVQTATNYCYDTTCTVSFGANTAAGNLIVVTGYAYYNSGADTTATGWTDTPTNFTYATGNTDIMVVSAESNHSTQSTIWYRANAPATSSITASVTTASTNVLLIALEISGVVTTTPLNQVSQSITQGGTGVPFAATPTFSVTPVIAVSMVTNSMGFGTVWGGGETAYNNPLGGQSVGVEQHASGAAYTAAATVDDTATYIMLSGTTATFTAAAAPTNSMLMASD